MPESEVRILRSSYLVVSMHPWAHRARQDMLGAEHVVRILRSGESFQPHLLERSFVISQGENGGLASWRCRHRGISVMSKK